MTITKFITLFSLVFYCSTTVSQLRMRGFHKPSPFINDIERSLPKLVESAKKTVDNILFSSHTIINSCYNAIENIPGTADSAWYKFRLKYYILNKQCFTDFHKTITQRNNTIQIDKALFEKYMLWYQLLPKGKTLASCPHVTEYIDRANSSRKAQSTLNKFRKEHSISKLHRAIGDDIFDNDWLPCLVRYLQYSKHYYNKHRLTKQKNFETKTKINCQTAITDTALDSIYKNRYEILAMLLWRYYYLAPYVRSLYPNTDNCVTRGLLSLSDDKHISIITPLQFAAFAHYPHIARVLIKFGATLEMPATYYDTNKGNIFLYSELHLLLQKDSLILKLRKQDKSGIENQQDSQLSDYIDKFYDRAEEPTSTDFLKLLLKKAKEQFDGRYIKYILAKDMNDDNALTYAIKSYKPGSTINLETVEILAQEVFNAFIVHQVPGKWEIYANMLKDNPELAPLATRYAPSAPSALRETVTSV